jgi:hypothetical protein
MVSGLLPYRVRSIWRGGWEVKIMEEEIIRQLLGSIKCGVCGQGFELANVNVMGKQDDVLFIQVVCSSCYTQCLVAVMLGERNTVKAVTDLGDAEFDKFINFGPVSSDEELEMHYFLNKFDGNFKGLFALR